MALHKVLLAVRNTSCLHCKYRTEHVLIVSKQATTPDGTPYLNSVEGGRITGELKNIAPQYGFISF